MARYTAKDMREAADNFWVNGVICEVKDKDGHVVKHIKHDAVIAMLRQAADAMEKEGKREKKYEYGVKWDDDEEVKPHSKQTAESIVMEFGKEIVKAVRRSVGEWEEI